MGLNKIDSIINKWINNDEKNKNDFFKKLIIHWIDIVENEKFARYSSPGKIIKENNNKYSLLIFSYNGSVTLSLQGIIKKIKQNIKLHIGYFPVNSIRIVQKAGLENLK